MFKRVLFTVALLVGTGNVAHAGDYAVGTIFNKDYFTAQNKYGVRGYFLIEPNGLPTPNNSVIYHTTTNHSFRGSETIVAYNWNSGIEFKIYKWVADGVGYVDNLHGTTNNTSWHSPANKYIGSGNGTVDSNFQKYVTTLNLGGVDFKAIYLENVSAWGNNTWNEVTKLKNYNTQSMETVMDISWNGNVTDNYATQTTQGMWAGALEVNGSGPFTNCNGKKAGNYLLDSLIQVKAGRHLLHFNVILGWTIVHQNLSV